MIVHCATDPVPDRRIVLPLVDQHRRRTRQREIHIGRDHGKLRLVVELIARRSALSRGRRLPNGPRSLKRNCDGDAQSRLEELIQLVINDAATVGLRSGHPPIVQSLAGLHYIFSDEYATCSRHLRLQALAASIPERAGGALWALE